MEIYVEVNIRDGGGSLIGMGKFVLSLLNSLFTKKRYLRFSVKRGLTSGMLHFWWCIHTHSLYL